MSNVIDEILESVFGLAYETQLLEVHPRQFVDGMYNVFYENVFEALKQLQSYLCEEKKGVVPSETIQLKTDFMFQELRDNLDKAMDKFEVFAYRNFFNIDSNVVLPEDKVHTVYSVTKEDEQKIDEEIEELTQQILKEKVRKSVLKQKKAEQKLVKRELMRVLEDLTEISKVIKNIAESSESLKKTATDCEEIRNFVNEFKKQKEAIYRAK